jgi:Ser/Thr protein kinase RdoA (MazF antagonist)
MEAPHPYAALGPDTVLDALDGVGLRGDGRLIALNSYENRVYQVWIEDAAPVIVKFYRPARWSDAAILEEHAFTRELAEREIPVIAPSLIGARSLHTHAGYRFAVYPKAGGRMPEFDQRDTLEWMGRFLARIHLVGRNQPYRHRPTLDIANFGDDSVTTLLGGNWLPADLREIWRGVAEMALEGARRCFERAGNVTQLRLHGDCHASNVLWTDDGPHFVDFDDSRMGPPVQDLWMLLSGDRASMSRQLADVLAGYEDFIEFDRRELHLIEALRTLRLLHYAAWLARRWDDPAFPAAFPWFGTQHYWQDRILELREQIAAMDEEPLWV